MKNEDWLIILGFIIFLAYAWFNLGQDEVVNTSYGNYYQPYVACEDCPPTRDDYFMLREGETN